jgi:hypothetical protein
MQNKFKVTDLSWAIQSYTLWPRAHARFPLKRRAAGFTKPFYRLREGEALGLVNQEAVEYRGKLLLPGSYLFIRCSWL